MGRSRIHPTLREKRTYSDNDEGYGTILTAYSQCFDLSCGSDICHNGARAVPTGK